MKPHEILLLGLHKRVTAFCRADGSVLWSTELEGGAGHAFITLASDERHVFATCHGKLHCLDLHSGAVIWSDPLKGYGYGIGSLCLPGQTAISAPGAAAHIAAQAAAVAAASGNAGAAAST